jgi:hypothetical protein
VNTSTRRLGHCSVETPVPRGFPAVSGAAEDMVALFFVLRHMALIAILIGTVDKNRPRQ